MITCGVVVSVLDCLPSVSAGRWRCTPHCPTTHPLRRIGRIEAHVGEDEEAHPGDLGALQANGAGGYGESRPASWVWEPADRPPARRAVGSKGDSRKALFAQVGPVGAVLTVFGPDRPLQHDLVWRVVRIEIHPRHELIPGRDVRAWSSVSRAGAGRRRGVTHGCL